MSLCALCIAVTSLLCGVLLWASWGPSAPTMTTVSIRTRRNALTTDHVMAILRAGTEKARMRVQHKVHQVRRAMALNDFDPV